MLCFSVMSSRVGEHVASVGLQDDVIPPSPTTDISSIFDTSLKKQSCNDDDEFGVFFFSYSQQTSADTNRI